MYPSANAEQDLTLPPTDVGKELRTRRCLSHGVHDAMQSYRTGRTEPIRPNELNTLTTCNTFRVRPKTHRIEEQMQLISKRAKYLFRVTTYLHLSSSFLAYLQCLAYLCEHASAKKNCLFVFAVTTGHDLKFEILSPFDVFMPLVLSVNIKDR